MNFRYFSLSQTTPVGVSLCKVTSIIIYNPMPASLCGRCAPVLTVSTQCSGKDAECKSVQWLLQQALGHAVINRSSCLNVHTI